LHGVNGATAATVNIEACNGPSDAKNPHEMGPATTAMAATPFPGNGGDQHGLSWRAIDQLARQVEDWAYQQRGDTDGINAQVEGEIRRRLMQAGILPEAIPVEVERVLQCLFEGQEARRSQAGGGS
jgi:hypothetical protein